MLQISRSFKRIKLRILSRAILGSLFISNLAVAAPCFEPSMNPVISHYLQPQPQEHETWATIRQMHQLIYQHRELIEPRLVYYRMIGESQAQAEIHNQAGSGAYGMFQFLGRPYRSQQTYEQILRGLYASHPGVSRRLIQLKYYLEVYVPRAAQAADHGYGCNRSKGFDSYTNLEKIAYLGWGSCNSSTLRKEVNLCQNNASYRIACPFAKSALVGNAEPICYNSSPNSNRGPHSPNQSSGVTR